MEEQKKMCRDDIIKMVEGIDSLRHLISIRSFAQVKYLKKDGEERRNEINKTL